MRDHMKLRAFVVDDEVVILIYRRVGFGCPDSVNTPKLTAFSLNNLSRYGVKKMAETMIIAEKNIVSGSEGLCAWK
ncbi:MAG: hypothetical protein QME81_03745 [bacterium]|nr:hypothetical protein [bacterium]